MSQGVILSGITPSNGLTIGNYLGALKNWVAMQHEQTSFFMVADLHAFTTQQDPVAMLNNSLELAAGYIGCGIDPVKSTVFIQSQVSAHAELGWILQCTTPLGWLKRMTQFKDKAGKNQENVGTGLFTYPVLQAADILLYHATHVPVGDDQKQHVELTRDIAISMNQRYGQDIFTIPEHVVPPLGARVRSLRDGTKKMSKSDPSDQSRINLLDDADTILQKVRKAKSDSDALPSEVQGLEGRAEAQNLVEIFAALQNITPQAVLNQFGGQNFAPFKQALADSMVANIAPIGNKMRQLLADKAELQNILSVGRDKAAEKANQTLQDVKQAVGFVV
jgi:tryptophanyl-tRNA synthetase